MSAFPPRVPLSALDGGPMDESELSWMRRVGDFLYGGDRRSTLLDGK